MLTVESASFKVFKREKFIANAREKKNQTKNGHISSLAFDRLLSTLFLPLPESLFQLLSWD